MAIRQTAAQKKAATEAKTAVTTTAGDVTEVPDAWGSEPIDDFNGHNLTDKADLIGVPFLIIGAEIEQNPGKDYAVAYVYALDVNGTEFEFSDASTGVREQVRNILSEKGLNAAPGAGFQKLRTRIMGGLRASELSVTHQSTGKRRTATTYYLAAAGRRVSG